MCESKGSNTAVLPDPSMYQAAIFQQDDRLAELSSSSSSLGTHSQISNVQGESRNSPAELVTVLTSISLSSDVASMLDTAPDVLTVVEPSNNTASSTVIEPVINSQQKPHA